MCLNVGDLTPMILYKYDFVIKLAHMRLNVLECRLFNFTNLIFEKLKNGIEVGFKQRLRSHVLECVCTFNQM